MTIEHEREPDFIIDHEAETDLLPTTDFDRISERAMQRRSFLKGSLFFGTTALVSGAVTDLIYNPAHADGHMHSRLGFKAVAANTEDTVTVPQGYNWHIVAKWGDPMWSKGKDFDHATRGDAMSSELSFGDNCDGMALFTHSGHNVLAVNNEYTNLSIAFGNRESNKPETEDDFRKAKAVQGVSIVEVAENEGKWSIVKDSSFNRRITPDTEMEITGPASGHDWMKTSQDPTGKKAWGTWNNCGNGRTPWGTYLACEENFNGYFSSSDENQDLPAPLKRYGVKTKDRGYGWAKVDPRFDLSKEINEPNRAGYIVEIDPLDPTSTPKKRTAMGRFKHENCEVVIAPNGHVVAYMGDDERGEFLYKFVSAHKYVQGGDNSNLLEEGSLFVAKFSDDGRGQWMALTPETTGMASQAEVCIHTRIAASKVGATTMDRPEWVSANPFKSEVYCCLTNNKNRGIKTNAGGDETPVGGPNPREKNNYGQIVRWWPANADHTSDEFTWDLFVTAGNPTVHKDAYAGSKNVTADNMFNSPDGLAFASNGLLFIQTDGNYSNKEDFAGMGNNQMLVADPETGEIKRFMVGPRECEVTGITWSGDKRTLFVGIQHPGEKGKGNSHFPDGGDTAPRSAVIAIRRDDNGIIG